MSFNSAQESNYHRKSKFIPITIFRFLITLILLVILSIGVLSAFKYFSGIDPFKFSPQTIGKSILASPETQKLISQVLGTKTPKFLIPILAKLNLNEIQPADQINTNSSDNPNLGKPLLFTFAVVADSHNDNVDLKKALSQAHDKGAAFVIGDGDYTDVGTLKELQDAKAVFDASGIPYYVTAGDHDLWNARDKGMDALETFKQVFGIPYKSFGYDNVRFFILNDSDDYLGVDPYQMNWFEGELKRVKQTNPLNILVFLHEPLYHPSSDHVMGKTNPNLLDQANQLKSLIKDNGVAEVISGDTHFYTSYTDPETGIKMTTAGAVTDQRNAQAPRFLLVDVYTDGSYNIYDTEIK